MSTDDIRDGGDDFLREYVVDGVPASTPNKPAKAAGRTVFRKIADEIDAVAAVAAAAEAGQRWTDDVRVRSTANVVIASALENGDTLNGVTLATGNRVFLGSQTAPAENGIYVVVASGAAARATDADSAADLARIAFLITEGTVGAGERWTLSMDAADITVGTTALSFKRTGIEVSTATQVAGLLTDVASLETAPGRLKPFADDATLSDDLRNRVRDIRLFGAEDHKNYSLADLIIDVSGLKKRLRVGVWDNATSKFACYESRSSVDGATVADFIATLPETLTLTDFTVSPSSDKRRVVGQVRLDLSGITDVFADLGSTSALIHADNQYTKDQQADYLTDHRADVLVTVGASGKDYTDFDDTQTALYSASLGSANVNGLPVSDLASYSQRTRILLTDEAQYDFTLNKLANFMEVAGSGLGSVLHCAAPSGFAGAVEAHGTHKLLYFTISTDATDKYALHMDAANRSVTSSGQWTFHRKVLIGMTLINPAGSTVAVLGGGIESGETWDLIGSQFINLNAAATVAACGVHNSGVRDSVAGSLASPYSAKVNIIGCSSPNLLGLDLSSVAAGPVNTAVLRDNAFNMIAISCYIADADAPDRAADRYLWNALGRYDGPVRFSDDRAQPVLATTAGQTPSGTAAALIFGTVDELGRGDLWIRTGSTKSLGARLGDCSSVNKTLTIGAQTHTFTTNLTAASNTDIISAINGTLTTYPVSEVDIQTEYVAPCQPQARMTNDSGVTIPKGRFVKRTAASTIALAGPGDTVFGWTYRAILNGLTGIVVTSRQVHENQIEGATSSTGAWGLAANGLLDYGAATKIGSTMGSIVEY